MWGCRLKGARFDGEVRQHRVPQVDVQRLVGVSEIKVFRLAYGAAEARRKLCFQQRDCQWQMRWKRKAHHQAGVLQWTVQRCLACWAVVRGESVEVHNCWIIHEQSAFLLAADTAVAVVGWLVWIAISYMKGAASFTYCVTDERRWLDLWVAENFAFFGNDDLARQRIAMWPNLRTHPPWDSIFIKFCYLNSQCNAPCNGKGTRYRLLQCVWYGTRKSAGNACNNQPRPAVMKPCSGPPCVVDRKFFHSVLFSTARIREHLGRSLHYANGSFPSLPFCHLLRLQTNSDRLQGHIKVL